MAARAAAGPAYREKSKPPGLARVSAATACWLAALVPTMPTGRLRGASRAFGHANASTASTIISGSTTATMTS